MQGSHQVSDFSSSCEPTLPPTPPPSEGHTVQLTDQSTVCQPARPHMITEHDKGLELGYTLGVITLKRKDGRPFKIY